MITVVNYGAGNIRSVAKALECAGGRVMVSGESRDISRAGKIVLPGVGSFGQAAEALERRGLIPPLREAVQEGRPFLGICLGFQLLFKSSRESANTRGLGWLDGTVERLPSTCRVPHLGWNRVRQSAPSDLWYGIPDPCYFYFAHSYIVRPENSAIISGITEYGASFASAITHEMLFGVQFHPEKSQIWGLRLLENFVRL
jgi:glutamine amidotransferase